MSDDPAISVQDMKDFLAAFNRHDADAIAEYFTDDVVFATIAENKEVAGKGPVRDYFAKMFATVKNVHFGEDSHSVDGERGFSEWVLTGINPDGSTLEVRGCDLFTFRGGKICRKDSFLKQTD